MLTLHFSNRYELLADALIERLAQRSTGPLVADTVIVPSAAVRRQLTLAIASRTGVCANVQFGFLASWLWQQVARLVPGVAAESPFSAEQLTWRVFALLGQRAFIAPHPRLAHYLAHDDELMRFELAASVAGLLDAAITYRPGWLDAWRHGQSVGLPGADATALADERWQAALWQRIATDLQLDAPHPLDALKQRLESPGLGPDWGRRAGLPAQAHVFALPAMAPLHVDLLKSLGQLIDLHVYALNPSREFWVDVVAPRQLLRLEGRGAAQAHEVGNPLLASWGRQTQAHIGMLIEAGGEDAVDESTFEPLPGEHLLAQLHNAVLDLRELAPGSVALSPDDRSVEVHVCHSLTRQIEVLHDRLLGLFAAAEVAGNRLRPADVLVALPDLEAAAPLVDAVFGSAPRARRIPYALTGRARSQVDAPARALLALLTLAASRHTAGALFDVLLQPIVARRYALDEDALQQIHEWLAESGVRWALDGVHRASYDLPPDARHTLDAGLNRLFAGYALPADSAGPVGPWLPVGNAAGSRALPLGALFRFAADLRWLQSLVAQPHAPRVWMASMLTCMERFIAPDNDEAEDVQALRSAITQLAESSATAGADLPIGLPIWRAALEARLDDPARGGVPGGSVTFAAMASLRNLPYRVVCVLGLDDGGFPTGSRPPEYDLIARFPRAGDRQRRTDERNLLLDLMLAARESLHLSYVGRSVRDNAPLPPSVLVAELLDLLVPAIAPRGADASGLTRARRRLVVEHPLQPFSPIAFETGSDERLRSFNQELADALRGDPAADPNAALAPSTLDPEADEEATIAHESLPFFAEPLSPPDATWQALSVERLLRFFRNPSRFLLSQRIGIDLPRAVDVLLDEEPLLADWEGQRKLAARLLPGLLAGGSVEAARRSALAGTELPGGALGTHMLDSEIGDITAFAGTVRSLTAAPCLEPFSATIKLTIEGEPWTVDVAFTDLRAEGLVRWRYDALRASDRLDAWLHHVALCAMAPDGVALRTVWIARDQTLTLEPVADARAVLTELVTLYRQGLSEPLHFYPKAAWAYVEDQRIESARTKWESTRYHPHGEENDLHYRLALRGVADPLDEAFTSAANAVFGTMCQHVPEPGA